MRRPVSFVCNFANSLCNRQANLLATLATSTPERFRPPSASGFREENPTPRIFESSVAAAFLGTSWRRFRPDARKIIHANLRDSRRTRPLVGRSSRPIAIRLRPR